MRRRTLLKTALAGATALAAPAIVQAEAARSLTFVPHADLASLDPVWTTADITRNYSLAVFDTLYGYDADFNVQPQMVAGQTISKDGRQWDLTLRDGLKFHDGEKVLARDCVATIQRWAKRNPMGGALLLRLDEISAPSDTVIRIQLKKPFALLPAALAEVYCAIMPERLAQTDAMAQIPEAIGSGPFKFLASERIPGSRVVFERNAAYVPRPDGRASFNAGPKIVHLDRVVWNFIPDAATAAAALAQGEIDWWENPSIDLVPSLRANRNLVVEVKDRTAEIGCLRFNHLNPPFDNPAIRRVVATAFDQNEVMTAVAGAEPSLIKTDVGLFIPGTPYANDVGVEVTRGPKDLARIKQELAAAGYNGERVVTLLASTIPTIFAQGQVAADTLKRIGMNVDLVVIDWVSVVTRRANKGPIDQGGWNIFFTNLGGFGNISPGPNIAIRGSGASAWFGWPTHPRLEALREAWFDAPDLDTQKKLCREMQAAFWQDPTFVPLGVFDQPTAYRSNVRDVPDGWPQFYGVRRT